MSKLTHKRLCELAVNWLKRSASRNGPGCSVAISETANWINGEIPDAIGWRPIRRGGSVLVEAKTSRADFKADFAKPHRRKPETGMGVFRYYLAPQGVIRLDELPPRWGLIEANDRGHLKVLAGHVLDRSAAGWRHDHNMYAEVCTLAMCLNRVGDPQKVQDILRESNNSLNRMAKRNDALSRQNHELETELRRLRSQTTKEPQ